MLYDKSSTSLAGAILPQSDFVPKLIQNLQEDPDTVVADFEELRKYGAFPVDPQYGIYSQDDSDGSYRCPDISHR